MKRALTVGRVVKSNYFCTLAEKEAKRPHFGLLFDIDGVIVRGKKVLPQAVEAFQKLSYFNPVTHEKQLAVPTVFVTNAGNALRQTKAKQLSEWLGIKIRADQVIMSHSPLKIFPQFHDRHVLVSGQGPVEEIAAGLGFTKVTTVDQLCAMFPHLDTVDHKRRGSSADDAKEKYLPPVEAVMLFGEPLRWETSLQLIIDVLVTNGHIMSTPEHVPKKHLPIFGCNMDLLWMSESHLPRFGHGCFLACLEALYKKITGYDLHYTVLTGKPSQITYHYSEHVLAQQARQMGIQKPLRTLYAIGDNPMTDIYGANLYNQYLAHKAIKRLKKKVAQEEAESAMAVESSHSPVSKPSSSDYPNGHSSYANEVDMEFEEDCAECMESVLVRTGVHSKPATVELLEASGNLSSVDHGHRDFKFCPDLSRPSIEVNNIYDAVEFIFEREKYASSHS